eukprot:s2949_g14.t1
MEGIFLKELIASTSGMSAGNPAYGLTAHQLCKHLKGSGQDQNFATLKFVNSIFWPGNTALLFHLLPSMAEPEKLTVKRKRSGVFKRRFQDDEGGTVEVTGEENIQSGTEGAAQKKTDDLAQAIAYEHMHEVPDMDKPFLGAIPQLLKKPRIAGGDESYRATRVACQAITTAITSAAGVLVVFAQDSSTCNHSKKLLEHCSELFVLDIDLMTTLQAKDIYVSWDGDQTTWSDYTRKVRLQFEKTEVRKRKLLAPELASRLTGRAWTVTAELDYAKLSSKSGVKYLLEFLRSRLCQTAVPDAGARLEELLIKLRRPPGMGFAQWSATLLESYRKLQRSLIRARARSRPVKEEKKESKSEKKTASEPQSEPASPGSSPGGRSRRSPTTRSVRGRGPADAEQGDGDQSVPGDDPQYEAVPQEDPDAEGEWQGWNNWYNRWTPEEWREWLKESKDKDDSDEEESDDELRWDELEMEEIEVLPDELLGWLLLRRANLPAAARLSVQASVQNSLKYRDIENALRDQEEELLQGDLQRHQGHRHRRTFWVEENGAWGLLTMPDDQQEDVTQEVHWVGHKLPPEVYHPGDKTAIEEDDEEIYWSWEADGYHGYVQDPYGQWLETDGYGNYWTSD